MSITTTIEQTADGTGGSPGYTESRVIRRAGRRALFAFCVYIITLWFLLCPAAGIAFIRYGYVAIRSDKKICGFSGLCPLRLCVCREISREQALGYSPPPKSAPARRQAEKPQIQKAAFGGKKSPAHAGRKIDYLISYLRCSICHLYCMHSSVQRYKQLFFYRQRRTF